MIELRPLEYAHDGVKLVGQLAVPSGPGPHPAVLVMHEARGLGPHMRRRALLLAEAGYLALATDMYGGGIYFEDPRESTGSFMAFQNDVHHLRARALAGFEAMRALPGADPQRLAAIGFCFGGQCVLELARGGADARAVVSFHGILRTAAPAASGAVRAKVLAIAGAQDPYAPLSDVAAFQAEMTGAQADWQLTLYGEGRHAFTDPIAGGLDVPGVLYDPLLDRLSWAQATAFLGAVLG
jgi:dienelactone hydrolase